MTRTGYSAPLSELGPESCDLCPCPAATWDGKQYVSLADNAVTCTCEHPLYKHAYVPMTRQRANAVWGAR